MTFVTNQQVATPLGSGRVQGPAFIVTDAHGQQISKGVLVRLPIDDITRAHLNRSNCITPQAKESGLWVFQEKELQ